MANDRIEKRVELKAPISRVWRALTDYWSHPKSIEKQDYTPNDTNEPAMLVEFRLEKTADGTLLVLTESGFDKLPSDRRLESFRRNEGGWTEQMRNLENYVARKP